MDKSQIVVNNGEQNVTFSRISRTGNRVTYATLDSSTLAGRATVTYEVVQPTERSAGRIQMELRVPIVENVDGKAEVTRFMRHTQVTFLPSLGNTTERSMFNTLVKNLNAETDVQTSRANLEPFG